MQYPKNPKSLSVGNRVIDHEHQKLENIIKDIGQLILVSQFSVLSEAVKALQNSLCEYFVIEENIAHAANFDFAEHNLAHQKLWGGFGVVTDKLINQNGKLSDLERKVCMDSLSSLLIRHIESESKSLKLVLDTYLYEFNPPQNKPRGVGWVI